MNRNSSPDSTAIAWQHLSQRLQVSTCFLDFIDCLFSSWHLMMQEVETLSPSIESGLEKALSKIYTEQDWNRRTAFRDFLTVLSQQLQRHAANPARTLLSRERIAGYDPTEIEIIQIIQERLPNPLQAGIINQIAKQLLCIYWARLAARTPLMVPGFLTTAIQFPFLFGFETETIRPSVAKFLELQRAGSDEVCRVMTAILGINVTEKFLAGDIVFERLADVYLSATDLHNADVRSRLALARVHLGGIMEFLGGEGNEPSRMKCGNGSPTLPGFLDGLRRHCTDQFAMPLQFALSPNGFIVPSDGETLVLNFPPWASFWSNASGHPYLSLLDEKIARHVFQEQIDFRRTLFAEHIQLLRHELHGLAVTPIRYEMLRTTAGIFSKFEELDKRTNSAFTAMVGAALGISITAVAGEDRKIWVAIVGVLGAGSTAMLPVLINRIATALAARAEELSTEPASLRFTGEQFEQLIRSFVIPTAPPGVSA